MNYLIVLSGGIGSRMMVDRPKQYIEINNKPIIQYTLECFDFSVFNKIIIVVSDDWKEYVQKIVDKNFDSTMFTFAPAGDSRQESILNGMKAIADCSNDSIVVVHDAARPCVKKSLVTELLKVCEKYDGAMPVIPVKDTIYLSKDRKSISGLLNRDELFAGQSPEAFNLKKYYKINNSLSKEELNLVRGSSEIASKNSLSVGLIPGDETNFKITTPSDLEQFKLLVGE